MTKQIICGLFLSLFVTLLTISAEGQSEKGEIFIASGAGYKKPVLEVCESFMEKNPVRINSVFGNMQTVSLQVRESGKVGLLVGDKKFLSNPQLGVSYTEYLPLGRGRLVLAYRKGLDEISVDDLTGEAVQRLSLPDTQKAIYGTAAREYLEGAGLWEQLESKILMASTVPQVSSYLISGEVDAGFINLTDAIAIADRIGGYTILDTGYSEISIVAGIVEGFEDDEDIARFKTFLASAEADGIFESYGL